MEAFLMKALQLIVALALLIIIHEFGHYLFARIFGIRVEKFYLFFDWPVALFKWKPRPKPGEEGKASWRDTEYGIGCIPLGGYCKISGMIDESLDTEQMALPPQPWEFRTKPAWQRLLVMAGGVMSNFILTLIIYTGIVMHWGERYIPFDAATEGFDFVPAAQAVGFRNGDIPYDADGERLDASQNGYQLKMIEAGNVRVIRGGDTVSIAIPDNFLLTLNNEKGFMAYRVPAYVGRLMPGEPAAKAGLAEGDRIVAIDTLPTPSFTELTAALSAFGGKPTTVTVERDGRRITMPVTPTEGGKLGFQLKPITEVYPTVTVSYGFLESIPKGWELGTSTLANYVGSMKYVFTREGAESLGGFGAIGNLFPTRWNWLSFWEITAFLSVVLAFMNILPIPGLDGGHIMFLGWEAITRRKVPENVLITAQYIGMGFLLLLLLYANGNDIFRAFLK